MMFYSSLSRCNLRENSTKLQQKIGNKNRLCVICILRIFPATNKFCWLSYLSWDFRRWCRQILVHIFIQTSILDQTGMDNLPLHLIIRTMDYISGHISNCQVLHRVSLLQTLLPLLWSRINTLLCSDDIENRCSAAFVPLGSVTALVL